MQLTTFETDGEHVHAGYTCPCGCTPSVTHQRGGDLATSHCCCGNEFVVGPAAERSLEPKEGFALETESRMAGWGEPVMAAWLIGPSKHPEPAAAAGHHHAHDEAATAVVDPVCGMTVEPTAALEKGLHHQHADVDYYFCGKGCYLDFREDPERFLDPSYVPSM